jgi:hypothetical protein
LRQCIARQEQSSLTASAGKDVYIGGNAIGGITYDEVPIALPLAIIAGGVDFLVNFFEDILGGGESPPPIPRQLRHNRHPLYPVILGVPDDLIPNEGSEGLKICGDPSPDITAPLQTAPILLAQELDEGYMDILLEDYLAEGIHVYMCSQGMESEALCGDLYRQPSPPPTPGPAIPPPPYYCSSDPFSNPRECNPGCFGY